MQQPQCSGVSPGVYVCISAVFPPVISAEGPTAVQGMYNLTFLLQNTYGPIGLVVSLSLLRLDECTTLWGEPERMYMQNMEQLHVSLECN